MKRKLWIAFLLIILFVALAMVAHYSTAEAQPLICKAASVYADGTVIERPCPPSVDGAEGLKMAIPEPGQFYRPGDRP